MSPRTWRRRSRRSSPTEEDPRARCRSTPKRERRDRIVAGQRSPAMADLIHRLRVIAQSAGEGRRRDLDRVVRDDPLLGRDLLESRDPRTLARAMMKICDRLGFESTGHALRLAQWMTMLGTAAGIAAS